MKEEIKIIDLISDINDPRPYTPIFSKNRILYFDSHREYIDRLVDAYVELRIRRVCNSLTRPKRFKLREYLVPDDEQQLQLSINQFNYNRK